jgi:HPt (histidine-containing phosphotransfer) domain-containing protein
MKTNAYLYALLIAATTFTLSAESQEPTVDRMLESAESSCARRDAQNLASVSSAAFAAGATRAQLGTNLRSAIATLAKGITVTNNGQAVGPFRVDGLPADLSLVTSNLRFDQDTGMIRYTPSTNQTRTNIQDKQQAISAGKRNAQNLASVSSAAVAAGATRAQLGTNLMTAIAVLSKGITVTNNGQVMGPFRVDGLPADLSLVTKNLTFDQNIGVIRYTPSTD